METVIITERIQRDGYVLKLTHEVTKDQEYRDYRLKPFGFFPLPNKLDFDLFKFQADMRRSLGLGA
jgi:hypothetical protein